MEVAEPVQATAYLAAACRAAEARRPHPRLRDELAQRFADARPAGRPGYQGLLDAGGDEVVARTVLLDRLLLETVPERAVVVSLGAGFCTRPYRLDLSGCAQVVEIDADPVLAVKDRVLAGRQPRCPVRRIGLDLRDHAALAGALAGLDPARMVLVTEGLLPYLPPAETGALAGTLAGALPGAVWLTDLVSVESARGMAQLARSVGAPVELYGLATLAPLEAHGWTAVDYRILPVARRGPVGRPGGGAPSQTSHRVVDGVALLRR